MSRLRRPGRTTGETIVTSMWKENGKIIVAAKTKERDTPVVANAAITLR